jgi:hypothetical protein
MTCVYYGCLEAAAVLATVLSGDADEMHETDNPLCSRHMFMVTERWLRELAAGGPAQRIRLVQA